MAFTTLAVPPLILIASQPSSHFPTLLSTLNLVYLNQGSWLFTHQISYFGTWDFLPLAMQLSHEGQTYILTLCLRSDLPQPDHWELSAGHFNWHEFRDGQPPLELFLVFGDGCLHLTTGNNNLASFCSPSTKQYSRPPNK